MAEDNRTPDTSAAGDNPLASADSANEDKDLEVLKKRLAELEESLKTTEGGSAAASGAAGDESAASNERDRRSVYVGNVHFKTVPQDLQEHFKDCGEINQITILVDKHTGQPKGFAYVEFEKEESVAKAMAMNGSMLHSRPIKVTAKRTNLPRFQLRQMAPAYGGYRPPRGYGAPFPGYRPRRRGFHPYM